MVGGVLTQLLYRRITVLLAIELYTLYYTMSKKYRILLIAFFFICVCGTCMYVSDIINSFLDWGDLGFFVLWGSLFGSFLIVWFIFIRKRFFNK